MMPRRRLLAGLISMAAGTAVVGSAVLAARHELVAHDPDDHVQRRLTVGPAKWFLQLMSAIAIKLTSSIDDVVWLAPFMAVRNRRRITQHAGVYLCVCLFQAVLALAISRASAGALNAANHGQRSGWSSDKILTVAAGTALAMYGLYLTREWYQETYGEDGSDNSDGVDEADEEKMVLVDAKVKQEPCYAETRTADASQSSGATAVKCAADGKGKSDQDTTKTPQTLLIVAFLGSLDDLTLFVPMLAGQAMGWSQLLLGTFISANVIVLICYFVTLCECVKDIIEKVPLFALVLFFATVLLVKGLTMH